MALIADMRNIAKSLGNRGEYENAAVVKKAIDVLKKQQVLLQSQEEDITEMQEDIPEMNMPYGGRKWSDRGPDRRSL